MFIYDDSMLYKQSKSSYTTSKGESNMLYSSFEDEVDPNYYDDNDEDYGDEDGYWNDDSMYDDFEDDPWED
jgi:hypothetical protein